MAQARDRVDRTTASSGLVVRLIYRVTTLLSLPVLLIGARGLFQLERTSTAVAEQQDGETLLTVGIGMLALGGAAWLVDRAAGRRRWVLALTIASVVWPLWITFVHWYDGR